MIIIWSILISSILALRVDLLSRNDYGGVYMGTIFINNQPIRVAFDTGSQNLAITSNGCGD